MAQNALVKALENESFKEFLLIFKRNANYFVAKSTANEEVLLLCLAHAWLDGADKSSNEEIPQKYKDATIVADKFEFDVERWKLINKLRDVATKIHILIADLEDIDKNGIKK